MSFLNAEWRKLAIANYQVDPEVLRKYVPFGTELDLWEGKCFVSVVGFMFLNTKMLGMKIPFHRNFEEVNLRFYVRRLEEGEWKRGVVFIKEIVPKPAITFVANTIYKEHYITLRMKHIWQEKENERLVEYRWRKNKKWNFIKVKASLNSSKMEEGGETEFITEHYWGYAHKGDSKSVEYEVTHPKWEKYDVFESEVDIDFGNVYGKDFGFLSGQSPSSVMLAEGSEITVESKRIVA